jgi:hypothetical protein
MREHLESTFQFIFFCIRKRNNPFLTNISNATFLPRFFMQVTSPYRDVLHHFDKVTHDQFVFIVAESGNYLACFKVETRTLEKGGGG